MKRNQHFSITKKPLRFETERAEWCVYHNMLEMYNEVYSHLGETGLAVRHPEPVLRDENGDVVVEELLSLEGNPSGLAFEINKTDVVGPVKQAWASGFAHTTCNQKETLH